MYSKIVNIYTRGKRIKGIVRLPNKPEYHDIELSLSEIKLLLKEGHRIEEKHNDKTVILNLNNFDMEFNDIILEEEKNKINTPVKNSVQEIKNLKSEIISLTTEKEEKDKIIKNLNNQISQKTTIINGLNQKVLEADTKINDLNKQIVELGKEKNK